MPGLEFAVDGVVRQLTGELLTGSVEETAVLGPRCRESYYRSLQNFASALIFGSGLVWTHTLPTVGASSRKPGDVLLFNDQYFRHKRIDKPFKERGDWNWLLGDSNQRQALRALIDRLSQIMQHPEHAIYWEQHMIREAYNGFHGKEPQSLNRELPGHEYEFKGRVNFYPNEEMEGSVPSGYVERMERAILSAFPQILNERRAQKSALPAYIRRNTVAHLGIHRDINIRRDEVLDPNSSLRVPHATRGNRDFFHLEHAWDFFQVTIPGLLEQMLEKAANEEKEEKRREVLVDQLKTASMDSDPKLTDVRNLLADAVLQSQRGDATGIKKIVSHLKNSSSSEDQREVGFVASGQRDGEYSKALDTLVGMGAGKGSTPANVVPATFYRVFPWMYPHYYGREGGQR